MSSWKTIACIWPVTVSASIDSVNEEVVSSSSSSKTTSTCRRAFCSDCLDGRLAIYALCDANRAASTRLKQQSSASSSACSTHFLLITATLVVVGPTSMPIVTPMLANSSRSAVVNSTCVFYIELDHCASRQARQTHNLVAAASTQTSECTSN